MKGRYLIVVFLLLAAVLVTKGLARAQTVTLRLNHQTTAATAGGQVDQWFADEVAKRTNGKVTIKIFWSEALGKAKEMLPLLRQGAIDMAGLSPSYYPSELPFFTAPNSLPMAMDNTRQAQVIMHTFLERVPAFTEEGKANNVRPIFFHVLNPYYVICKQPVRKLDDLKGKKMRTWGEDMPRLAQAAGAVPVTLFLPELYESLQRGVIDCAPFSLDYVVSYKLHEVAKYLTQVVAWQGPTYALWINLDKWNALPGDARKVMLEVAEEAKRKDLEKLAEAEKAARETMARAGVEFISFPENELRRWVSASPDFFADWVAKMEKLGKGDAARQTVALWKDLRAQYR
jgi:TRAP-type C4-dicarboxylate transport system substrate-binding protein